MQIYLHAHTYIHTLMVCLPTGSFILLIGMLQIIGEKKFAEKLKVPAIQQYV